MLNKKLVLGGLVAGSFLLPLVANAGVVTGPCVTCHTMHASQDGIDSPATPQNQLLRGTGCNACHDYTTNDTDGLATGTGIPAPQVGSEATNPTAGGSFYSGGNDAQQHNVALSSNAAVDSTLGNTPPGGAAMAQLTCSTCHGGQGGHHGTLSKTAARTGATNTNTYRQLYNAGVGVAVSAGHANYNVNDSGSTGFLTAGANDINAFCATCHTAFHGAGQGTGASPWLRHPTDFALPAAYDARYNINVTGTELVKIPLGNDGVSSRVLLCVTCHRPHGSQYADLLRFNYDLNIAGGATLGEGCEECHGAK
jgi:hypothetical protein